MTNEKMKNLLSNSEKINVEYKLSENELNNSVFETISSFSNRFGGYILLGVSDNGTVVGVNPSSIVQIKRNFSNVLNNENKMSPTLYLVLEEYIYEGKHILFTYVPESSTVVKCSGKIYDRNEDGDYDITNSPIQLENLYNRKSTTYFERKIFPFVKEEDLRLDLMPYVRNLVNSKNPKHPWLGMTDHEIMVSAGLYETNYVTGEKGFNLAAILLFGKDTVIQSCVPGYVTDALYRVDNLDRYDDRIQVNTNLIESYDKLMEFIEKHTSDRFVLINNINTSVRNIIAREIITNILVHRDYSSAFPAKVIIDKNYIRTENWCKARRQGKINEEDFSPYPKNPLLANFFVQIGRAEQIGSGIKNLYKYTKIYTENAIPTIIENDIFKVEIPLNKYIEKSQLLTERQNEIVKMIREDDQLHIDTVMNKFNISRSTVFRDYQAIKETYGYDYDKKKQIWNLD